MIDILGSRKCVSENDKNKEDVVNHPKHYEGSSSLECIEVMRLLFGDNAVNWFCLLNAFKYIWRHKFKNGIEDLNKAKWYLTYVGDSVLTYDMESKYKSLLLLWKQKYYIACKEK